MKFVISTCCIMSLIAFSCKTQPHDSTLNYEVFTSDSIEVPSNSMAVLSPNRGVIRGNYYVAPNSIGEPQVEIEWKDYNNNTGGKIKIVRQNASDTLIKFNQSILPILETNCNFKACHGNGFSAGGVNFQTYTQVLKTVSNYQPIQSLLYLSLIKTDELRRMPPAGQLHAYKIIQVRNWIEQGALNN